MARRPPLTKRRQGKRGGGRRGTTKTFMALIKESKPCMDCGGWFPFYVMQFDHVRGDKMRSVSSMNTYSVQSVMDEIEKCDLVCANCHAIRTYLRKQNVPI